MFVRLAKYDLARRSIAMILGVTLILEPYGRKIRSRITIDSRFLQGGKTLIQHIECSMILSLGSQDPILRSLFG
jgi:hypothetical protein